MDEGDRHHWDEERGFSWARIDDRDYAIAGPYVEVYLVRVKSESEIGREYLDDPLTVLCREIPDAGIDGNWTVSVHRARAEVPYKRVHLIIIVIILKLLGRIFTVEYKLTENEDCSTDG
jgi:hypothetical protein